MEVNMLYDVEKLKKELIEVDKQLYYRGLTSSGGGGPSIRIPCYNYDGSKVWTNRVVIKGWAPRIGLEWVPSYGYVATVDLDGNVIGPERPKEEVAIHLGVYNVRDDVGAVIHAHPPYLIAYMMARGKLKETPGSFFSFLTEAPMSSWALDGTSELAKNVVEAFKGNKTKLVLMENHGVTVAGGDLYNAYFTLDKAEDMAKIFFLSHLKLE